MDRCQVYGAKNLNMFQKFSSYDVKVHDDRMSSDGLSKYRYHIDLGGGGGTTVQTHKVTDTFSDTFEYLKSNNCCAHQWRGTLTKLMMPGVLFHHITYMKDWYHDEMIPWKHFIPIQWDLSDLEDKYKWALANPKRSQAISEEATKLAKYLISSMYMEKLYEELYRDYLFEVVSACQPNANVTFQEILETYAYDGYAMTRISTCDETRCSTKGKDGTAVVVPYVASTTTS